MATTATPIEQRGYARPDALVTTDWVAAHLQDPAGSAIASSREKQAPTS